MMQGNNMNNQRNEQSPPDNNVQQGVRHQSLPDNRLTTTVSFIPQRLSLETATSPLIPKVAAPFAGHNERKRALTAAVYYSECLLNGIVPIDADTAAIEAQNKYDKWWINATYQQQEGTTTDNNSKPSKRRRNSLSTVVEATTTTEDNNDDQELQHNDSVNILTDDDGTMASEKSKRSSFTENTNHNQNGSISTMSIREISLSARYCSKEIIACKMATIEELKNNGGDTTSSYFLSNLNLLHTSYVSRGYDARWKTKNNHSYPSSNPFQFDGTWLTLSKPRYTECLGYTPTGESLYSLGRLSFDMFRPTTLQCSIQGVFNSIRIRPEEDMNHCRPLVCPTKLQTELLIEQSKRPAVRIYE